MASAIQGVDSNYRTDLFAPIIERLAAFIGHDPETVESERFSYQVVADHSRAMTFLLAEGVTAVERGARLRAAPDHASRGASRAAARDQRAVPAARPAAVVIDIMGDVYTHVRERRGQRSCRRVEAEEEKFARTLEAGSARLDELVAAGGAISGADAFRLHDTFGFPIDLTIEMAAERGVSRRSCGLRRGHGRAARAVARREARRVCRSTPRSPPCAASSSATRTRRAPTACASWPSCRASGPPSCSTERPSTPRAAGRSGIEAS